MDASTQLIDEPSFWRPCPWLDRLLVKPFLTRIPVMVDSNGFPVYFPSNEEAALDMFGVRDDKRTVYFMLIGNIFCDFQCISGGRISLIYRPDREEEFLILLIPIRSLPVHGKEYFP